MASGEADVDVDTVEANEHADMNALQASIKAIHADIKAGHADMKKELNGFCETIKRDMKEELGNFKEEVNQKLSEIGVELKNAEVRLDEVETRVAEVEEWNANAKSVLLETLPEATSPRRPEIHDRLFSRLQHQRSGAEHCLEKEEGSSQWKESFFRPRLPGGNHEEKKGICPAEESIKGKGAKVPDTRTCKAQSLL